MRRALDELRMAGVAMNTTVLALPMLLQRADDQYRWEAPDTPEAPSVTARRMWYDTVGHGHVPALRCAIDSLGADRLLLGTDFP